MISGKEKIRNVIFILLGVFVLVVKQSYNGPYPDIVKSYSGNLSISFAIYFIVSISSHLWKRNKLITILISLAIVELFEITNGYGITKNVYDTNDLFVNLLGVTLAYLIDRVVRIEDSVNLKR